MDMPKNATDYTTKYLPSDIILQLERHQFGASIENSRIN